MRNVCHRLCCLLLPALALAVLTLACAPRPKPTDKPAAPESNFAVYVGNAACKPCHPTEFESHARSRHMQTLHAATPEALQALAPPLGPTPGGIAFLKQEERLAVKTVSGQVVALDFALGSGKAGMTFLTLLENGSKGSAEIYQSYFPRFQVWHPTPGQQGLPKGGLGRVHDESVTRHCLSCHAVTLPLDTPRPEPRFFGVGCEACHGPGSRHVEAKQQGRITENARLRALHPESGKAMNELCGRCHRTAADLEKMDARERQSTQRFQPYGLSLSACFKESGDKLTCVTCHNPHEDASKDEKRYEKICLSCHTTPKKACPVNPKEKCIGCHMPTRPVFPGSPLPNAMADHYIRVLRK